MNEWNIQSRAHACQACGRSFSDQQPYHTALFDVKSEIQRLDLCEPCWKGEGDGARDRKGFISHWQGVYEAPPSAPPEAIQKETAESLLRKLIELDDAKYAAARFILAVMLERKRILKVKEQVQREGGRVFLYEQSKTGDLFTIPDPNLQLNQLEAVQRDVAQLLEHGLNPPPAESQAAELGPSSVAATVRSQAELSSPSALDVAAQPPTAQPCDLTVAATANPCAALAGTEGVGEAIAR